MFGLKSRLLIPAPLFLLLGACSPHSSSPSASEKTGSGAAPVAVSITPSSGSGAHQSFTFVTSDPQGASHIYRTHIQFRSASNPSAVCYVVVLPPNNLALMNDELKAWLDPIGAGVAGASQNSYCGVNGAASSVQENGTNRTVQLDMTFKPAMLGENMISLTADDRQGTVSAPVVGKWTVQ